MAAEEDVIKLERDLRKVEVDFEKSVPFAEWCYVDVDVPTAHIDVTVRHTIKGRGRIVMIPVHWQHFVTTAAPNLTTAPALYTRQGDTVQFDGYLKVRCTMAPIKVTVLLVLRRDG